MGEDGVRLQQLRRQRHEYGDAAQEAKHDDRLLHANGATAKRADRGDQLDFRLI